MEKKYLCYSKEEDKLYVSAIPVGECIGTHSKEGYESIDMHFTNAEGNSIRISVNSNLGYFSASYLTASVLKNGEPIIDFDCKKLNYRHMAFLEELTVNAGNSSNLESADWDGLFTKIINAYERNKFGYIGKIETYVDEMLGCIHYLKNGKKYKEYNNDDAKEDLYKEETAFLFITIKINDLCNCLNQLGIATYSIFREAGCERISFEDNSKLQNPIKYLMKRYWDAAKTYYDNCHEFNAALAESAIVRVHQVGDINENLSIFSQSLDCTYLAELPILKLNNTIDDSDEYHTLIFANRYWRNNVYIYGNGEFITPITEKGYNIIQQSHKTPGYFMAKRDGECYSILSTSEHELRLKSTDYIDAHGFSHGYSRVKDRTGKWGIINILGEEIYECIFDEIFPIKDTPFVRVKQGSHEFNIDLKLNILQDVEINSTGISEISCRNFRKLENIKLSLSSVNFIVGKNNAGKSTFIKLIDKICYFISGVNYKFTLPNCYRDPQDKRIINYDEDITFGHYGNEINIFNFAIAGVSFSFTICANKIERFSVGYHTTRVDYDTHISHILIESNGIKGMIPFTEHLLKRVDEKHGSIWDILDDCIDQAYSMSLKKDVSYYPESVKYMSEEERQLWFDGINHSGWNSLAILKAIERCGELAHVPVFFASKKELDETKADYETAKKQLVEIFSISIMSGEISINEIDKDIKAWIEIWIKEMEVGDTLSNDLVITKNDRKLSIEDMGTGAKHFYILLIKIATHLIKCLQKPTFTPILQVEEPEQNLHPMLQSKLADFFLDVVELESRLREKYRPGSSNKNKLQIIVETHSEYIIRRTQVLVADKNEYEREKSVREGEERIFSVDGYDTSYDIKDECPFKVFYFPSEDDGKYANPYGFCRI